MFRVEPLWLAGFRLVIVTVLLMTTAVSASSEPPAGNVPIEPAIVVSGDPLTILRMFCDFLRAGQIDAAVNLLADDVVLIDAAGQLFDGKDSVRGWLTRLDFDDTELCDIWIRGNQIAWTVRVYQGDGFDLANGWAMIRQGKIALLSFAE